MLEGCRFPGRGVVATISVPNAMRLRGCGDVKGSGAEAIGSGAEAIGSGIAVKQMDEGAGDSLMLARLNMISREISSGRPKKIQKYIIVPKSIYDIRCFRRKTSISK